MSVWVRLYFQGQEQSPRGQPFKIEPIPEDINDLTEAVKIKTANSLQHCDAADLSVYPPGTDLTTQGYENSCIEPWENVPTTDPLPGSGIPRPVMVVAPSDNRLRGDAACSSIRGSSYDNPLMVVAPAPRVVHQQPSSNEESQRRPLDLFHLESITPENCRWIDHSYDMPFTGRNAFFPYVKHQLGFVKTHVTSKKDSVSIVFASVSGTGKTISMLQLKEKLSNESKDSIACAPIVVSYLGFGSNLELNHDEMSHIRQWRAQGAEEVLARRLVAATILSHQNSGVKWSSLPTTKDVYRSFSIPTVTESQTLLYEYMDQKNLKSISIVAGVDRVHRLNAHDDKIQWIGLGSFFLDTLRKWQVDWRQSNDDEANIYLLPLGTGIELDWCYDSTTGKNKKIRGSDATLISKSDFTDLTKQMVQKLKEQNQFGVMFGTATEETVVENVSAMYWPRVQLLQWFGEHNLEQMSDEPRYDGNSIQWNKWLSKWMVDEPVNLALEKDLAPGKSTPGNIHALFELLEDQFVKIVPDGYAAESILHSLGKVPSLQMPGVYARLEKRFQSLDPYSLVVGDDEYTFEEMGFDVVALAIHVGLYAILEERKTHLSFQSASETQKSRLGLALWFADHGALLDFDLNTELPPPMVLDQDTIREPSDFYPFKDRNENELREDVKKAFRKSEKQTKQPLYIQCGKNACCDYLYFWRTARQEKVEWICTICDAKHTNTEPTNISGGDQKNLYDAAIKVQDAISNMKDYTIKDIRLVFVTNNTGKADSEIKGLDESKRKVQTLWPNNVGLELLNKDTFDCGPFSDVLMARRHRDQSKKRKHEFNALVF